MSKRGTGNIEKSRSPCHGDGSPALSGPGLKLPYAMSSEGRVVRIGEVERGLACGCVCTECGGRLVAVKGNVVRHHFRHSSETNCGGGVETLLHEEAKRIVCESPWLKSPDDMPSHWHARSGEAQAEVWLGGIRPDVMADYGILGSREGQGPRFPIESVAIEILVTHAVDEEKRAKLVARQSSRYGDDTTDKLSRMTNLVAFAAETFYRRWTDLALRRVECLIDTGGGHDQN
jgi:hypothetical protein